MSAVFNILHFTTASNIRGVSQAILYLLDLVSLSLLFVIVEICQLST